MSASRVKTNATYAEMGYKHLRTNESSAESATFAFTLRRNLGPSHRFRNAHATDLQMSDLLSDLIQADTFISGLTP